MNDYHITYKKEHKTSFCSSQLIASFTYCTDVITRLTLILQLDMSNTIIQLVVPNYIHNHFTVLVHVMQIGSNVHLTQQSQLLVLGE